MQPESSLPFSQAPAMPTYYYEISCLHITMKFCFQGKITKSLTCQNTAIVSDIL